MKSRTGLPRKRSTAGVAAAFLGLALAVSACSLGHGDPTASSPHGLLRISCPGDVNAEVIIPHRCYFLRVPENVRHPGTRQVNVFVARLSPPGRALADPVLVLGNNVGDTPHYSGYVAGPARTHRVYYVMEPRGTGHSTPSLACPETRRLSTAAPNLLPRFRQAVRSCRGRLLRSGVDPRHYDLDAVSSDANALRRALRIPRWNLAAIGSASHYAIDIARRYPSSTRALILDSPDTLQPIGTPAARTAVAAAWRSLVDDCKAQVTCERAYPRLSTLWGRTATRLASHPLTVTNGKSPLRLDPEDLARLVRSYLAGPGPTSTGQLPSILLSLLRGELPSDALEQLTADHDVCLGYRTECSDHESALGAYLTVMCRRSGQPTDVHPSPALPLGVAAFDTDDPYLSACSEWGRQAAEPAMSAPAGVPSLVLTGAVDPFAAGGSDAGQTDAPLHFLIKFAGQTYNALGFNDCPLAIRNAWLNDPTHGPSTSCLRNLPSVPFALS
jgi:pimeloyl-ACP methyl ester carboxylesterase